MPSRRDAYLQLLDEAARDQSISLEQLFKTLFEDVDARLSDVEGSAAEFVNVKRTAVDTVLAYTQDQLADEFEAVRDLADLGLLFEGQSSSIITVGLGVIILAVDAGSRSRFTPAGYVGLMKTGDRSVFMSGTRVGYDRNSGQLIVNIDRVAGAGTYSSWTIVAVSGTDYAASASAAATSAAAAANSKALADSVAAAAVTYRDSASAHKTDAEAARDAAQAAQIAAAASEAAAAMTVAGIDTNALRYIGPSASNPTTRPSGAALVTGDLYWNTASNEMRVWSGSAWIVAYVPSGSAVNSWNSRTGSVLPADADYNADQIDVSPTVAGHDRVQAVLAAHETAIGAKLSASAVSAFALAFLDDADAAAVRTTLGVPASSHDHAWSDITSAVPGTISALAGGTAAADKIWVYSGAASGAMQTVTAFALALLDDVDAAAMRTTIDAAPATHGHSIATAGSSGFMSNTDKSKLDGVEAGANAYVHPSGDGNRHVPVTSTTSNGKVLKAGATAASEAWGNVAWSEIVSLPTAIDALDGLIPAADRFAYYTGAATGAIATLTAFARTLLDDVDASAARTTLGAAASSHTHVASDVSDATTVGKSVLTAVSGAAARSSINAAEDTAGVPTGAIMAFAMSTPPTGWLECDGSQKGRIAQAALFAKIGTTYGAGDGSTTFNLPNLRGEFVRGWDNGRNLDADRVFGSAQADEIKSHTHTASTNSAGNHTHAISANSIDNTAAGGAQGRLTSLQNGATGDNDATTGADGAHTHTVTVNATGGTETRPRNVALLYCIKT